MITMEGYQLASPLPSRGQAFPCHQPHPSLGSTCFHAIASKTPEMLQIIQQDAFISDLTEWVEAYIKLRKDLAGLNSKFRKLKKSDMS